MEYTKLREFADSLLDDNELTEEEQFNFFLAALEVEEEN